LAGTTKLGKSSDRYDSITLTHHGVYTTKSCKANCVLCSEFHRRSRFLISYIAITAIALHTSIVMDAGTLGD
jgi:hypothetical protein